MAGRYELVGSLEAHIIGLKGYQMHGYQINNDTAYVDKRLLKRMRRKNIRRARAEGYVLESNPRRFNRTWWRAPEGKSE